MCIICITRDRVRGLVGPYQGYQSPSSRKYVVYPQIPLTSIFNMETFKDYIIWSTSQTPAARKYVVYPQIPLTSIFNIWKSSKTTSYGATSQTPASLEVKLIIL